MKEKQISFNVLEVEDVERLVSEVAGREIKVGEMDVTVIDGGPVEGLENLDISSTYMGCVISVDGKEIHDEKCSSPLDKYMPDMAYIPEEYIFDFSTDLFKSYERYSDNSDY